MAISKSPYVLISCIILFLSLVSASDVLVWQGQYYTGTKFNTGIYEFNFTVYDALTGGDICYSNTTTLTTGNFGEWKTEQSSVNSLCNNVSKDYFLEIKIDNLTQGERRRLMVWNSLRKNVNEKTNGILTSTQFSTSENVSGSVRWFIRNVNPGNTSLALFSIMNDAGDLLTLSMTSSNYFSVENNRTYHNQPALGQSTFNEMYFVNGRYTGFKWFTNPNNDTSNVISNIMSLDLNGNLLIFGNLTTTQTGFFSYLGSLVNRITKLLVQDININGTIDGSGNIDLTGNIKTDGNLTVEGDFVLGGNLNSGNNLNVDKNISAVQYIAGNQAGITDNSTYNVCIDFRGAFCSEWCILEITGGIITGCG